MVGASRPFLQMLDLMQRVAPSNANVMLLGETGTGKELVARYLHDQSNRSAANFVAINCGAIPEQLIESELFGAASGAYTGATQSRQGKFEFAKGGTVFLDEIESTPASLQVKLLRVLEERKVTPVGDNHAIDLDVRIVAATKVDLMTLVEAGEFRADLYYRLNLVKVSIPALRDRKADIPLLFKHFSSIAATRFHKPPAPLSSEAKQRLLAYDWPGNVRQLENVCRWLTVMAPAQEIHVEDLPPEIKQRSLQSESTGDWESLLKGWVDQKLANDESGILDEATAIFEKIMIQSALAKTGGRRQEAALLLGCGRNTLTRKIKELEIDE